MVLDQTEYEKCLECGHQMKVNPGYVTWCEKCNWNIDEEEGKPVEELIHKGLKKKSTDRLFEEFKYSVDRRLPFSKQRIYTYLLAILVHGSTFAILGMAIFFYSTHSSWLFILANVMVLLWITIILPYRKRLPGRAIRRDEFPELYGMVDEIGDRMNVPPVDMIILNEEYDAYILHLKRNKRAIVLGVPFLAALTMQEKIAVISQQMSHFAHPNISNSSLVERAKHVLDSWYDTVDPQGSGLLYWVVFPLIILRLLLFAIISSIYALLIKSMRQEMHRLFYIADHEASETAGSEAVLSLFLKFEMEGLFFLTAEQVAEYQYNKELYDEFRNRMAAVPGQEILRLQRLQEMRYDEKRSYHPPMKNRIDLIREHWAIVPAYRPDPTRERRFNEEFRDLEQRSQRILLNDLRGAG